jgi:sortase A
VTVRRIVRIFGTVLIAAGVGLLVWVGVVWRWQDPFTALYTHWKQHELARSYDRLFADYHVAPLGPSAASLAAMRRTIAHEARLYRREAQRGQAIGRITVRRLGLNMILVNGTDHDTLKKGPGRDLRTFMPGEGQLIYIAGHRTTYLAPFAHIEKLRPGDLVVLEVPYATFLYRIFKHRIVDAGNLTVLRSHNREVVELQACHPRFFASHRYIAYGRLFRIEPRGGAAFAPAGNAVAAARRAATHG